MEKLFTFVRFEFCASRKKILHHTDVAYFWFGRGKLFLFRHPVYRWEKNMLPVQKVYAIFMFYRGASKTGEAKNKNHIKIEGGIKLGKNSERARAA